MNPSDALISGSDNPYLALTMTDVGTGVHLGHWFAPTHDLSKAVRTMQNLGAYPGGMVTAITLAEDAVPDEHFHKLLNCMQYRRLMGRLYCP